MNPWHQARFEGDWIDRAPACAIRRPGPLRDAARLLRWNDVGDSGLVGVEIRRHRHGRRVDRGGIASGGYRHPFEIGVELLPGIFEKALHGEGVLGVEHYELGTRLAGL